MPFVPLETLPDSSRIWIFGSDRPLEAGERRGLLDETDRFLEGWAAHGSPLKASRDWTDTHFLTIAVDQSTAGASGCSIDGLFRTLSALGPRIGANLVGSGRVFYRDATGAVHSVSRDRFTELASSGEITPATKVFDTTLQTLGDWRERFERTVADSWHAQLLPESAR
jgi:hypothetical protein